MVVQIDNSVFFMTIHKKLFASIIFIAKTCITYVYQGKSWLIILKSFGVGFFKYFVRKIQSSETRQFFEYLKKMHSYKFEFIYEYVTLCNRYGWASNFVKLVKLIQINVS